MSSRSVKILLSGALSLAIMVAIYLFSAQSGGESGSLSTAVAQVLARIFVPGFDLMSAHDQLSWVNALSWPVRKTAHATEYGCLAISLVMTCWQVHSSRGGMRLALGRRLAYAGLAAFAISILYAASDEAHQLFVDGRAGQFADVLVDASGAAVGCLLCMLVIYLFMRRRVTST